MSRKKKVTPPSTPPVPDRPVLPTCPASQVKMLPMTWLAKPWLPLRCVVMLEGRKASGKSHLACAFAAHATGRDRMPGQDEGEPRTVIWGAGEESIRVDTRPKLFAAKADLSKVLFLGMDNTGKRIPMPRLPDDLDALDALVEQTRCGLLVIDPLRSVISRSVRSSDEQDMGRVLEGLAEIADRHDCCVLLQRHLRKSAAKFAVDEGIGSVAIAAVARLLIRADPAPPGEIWRTLSVTEGNRNPQEKVQQFQIIPHGFGTRILWGDLIAGGTGGTGESQLDPGQTLEQDVATVLIERELLNGPRHAADIYAAAQRDRISPSAVYRAAAKLGVTHRRVGFGSEGYFEWSLARTCKKK